MRVKSPVLILAILCLFPIQALAQEGTLTVTVTGFPNDTGKAMIGLFNSAQAFPDHYSNGKASAISQGRAQAVFSGLAYGWYAVAVYQDENGNGQLDKNFVGKPKEPYGVSQGARGVLGPPPFDDAKFQVNSPETAISIRVE